MKLILRNDHFDVNRIKFRKNKSSIKLLYDINDIYMIGITLKVKYNNILIKNSMIYINLKEKYIDLITKIDNYLNENIDNYVSFISNKRNIKVKNHNNNISYLDQKINFTINCIKKYEGKHFVQMFTI